MKKIGIVTFNDANNYGAFLQEYALFKYIKKNKYEVEVINYENKEFSQLYKYSNNIIKRRGIVNKLKILYNILLRPRTYSARIKKNRMFKECIKREITLSSNFNETIFNEEDYDCFISGSDQVWNVRMTGYNYYYFLNFVNDNKKKKSYAASFGRTEFNDNDYEIFKDKLSTFDKILVREKSGAELLARCEINSEVVLDPTFLLDSNEWKEFSKNSDFNEMKKGYILLYVVSEPTNMYRAALKYAKEKNLDIILLGRNSDIVIDGVRIKAKIDVGPYEFISYLLNADAVFTTSFHGAILSINNNVNFYYELSKAKINNNARIIDIIKLFNLNEREIKSENVENKVIDWSYINKVLEVERNKSQSMLLSMINNEEEEDVK